MDRPALAADSDLADYVDDLAADIDTIWRAHFAAIGEPYERPEVVMFDHPVDTACGEALPNAAGPFYCPLDQTIYLDMPFLDQIVADFGVGAVANALSHEWGHHLQQQLGIAKRSVAISLSGSNSLETELQADCFAGAWTQSAEVRGVLTAADTETAIVVLTLIGDSAEALAAGNAYFDTQHGSGTLRSWWFLQGYFFGYDVCVA